MVFVWIWLSIGAGALAAFVLAHAADVTDSATLAVGVLAAFAALLALRPLANRWRVVQINSHWPPLCKFARGKPRCFDAPIEAAAQRLVTAAREVDEIVVVGHSGGGALAPAVVARARARSRRRASGGRGGTVDGGLDRAGSGAASQGGVAARSVRPPRDRA